MTALPGGLHRAPVDPALPARRARTLLAITSAVLASGLLAVAFLGIAVPLPTPASVQVSTLVPVPNPPAPLIDISPSNPPPVTAPSPPPLGRTPSYTCPPHGKDCVN